MQILKTAFLATAHGFSTRLGGVSEGVYSSFNLGLSTGDDATKVALNRRYMLEAFGVSKEQVCALEQVHSARVITARASWYKEKADASVSNDPDLMLIISTADCLPILFHDPVKKVVAAAHAGWRGTLEGISQNVIEKMQRDYGSSAADIRVLIGPAIQGNCYQVGSELIKAFDAAGFPETIYKPDDEGRHRLDLAAANSYLLKQLGVKHLHNVNICTHCESSSYFSHRRDGLRRGSHWSVIKLET